MAVFLCVEDLGLLILQIRVKGDRSLVFDQKRRYTQYLINLFVHTRRLQAASFGHWCQILRLALFLA